MDVDKKKLKEHEIRTIYITPALTGKGWEIGKTAREEYYFTDGRILVYGKQHSKATGKMADYLLFHNGNPIAVIEAKDNNHAVSSGIQQAIDYANILDLKFAYSSNGDGFVEHDFFTGKERQFGMNEFPTEDELYERFLSGKHYTPEERQIVETPYYYDGYSHEPRYYQRIAVDRTVEAIAHGQQRILLVMATGTGKTFTAFQIIHKLHKSGAKKKILYLADRNGLIDQTMSQDFKPFQKFMTKITTPKDGSSMKINTAFEVYMALYHQLVGHDGEPDPFSEVKPEFFDLIIVDECHRGSAKDDSAWRKVLEYFKEATQIGMTATPKAEEGANNLEYFGKPIYTYSLLQGIQDGFLAPYRVTNSYINIDLQGWTPEEGEVDLFGNEIKQQLYQRQDIGRTLAIKMRRKLVAHRITRMLHDIGRMTKTIVFCPDIEEAAEMRTLLAEMNADLCKKSPYYVTRIVGEDTEGKRQLDNFLDVDEPYPTIATTSELLSTGFDCKTCGLIVIDKEINSMTEFKQIIGRGTRLRTDKGKWHLEILDFRNATSKFKDPEFDGDPIPGGGGEHGHGGGGGHGHGGGGGSEPHQKYTIEGSNISIASELVSVLGEDGKTMKAESLTSFARKQILRHYESLDDFINKWNAADKKQAILDELKEYSILIEAVRNANPSLKEADVFDIICHVAFDQKPLTRKERANNVKKRNYFGKFEGKAREVLEALLDKYAENGILDFEKAGILEIPPFNQIGKPAKIVKLFGGAVKFDEAIREMERIIYETPLRKYGS